MIIIIDGYNLLKQIFPKEKGKSNKNKITLIKQLGLYKLQKKTELDSIVLVFDGGDFSHASREVKNAIVVMHAGYKNSADEWIIAFIKKNREKEILLVTMDRELIDRSKLYNAISMGVDDFYNTITNYSYKTSQKKHSFSEISNDIHKFEHNYEEPFFDTTTQRIFEELIDAASSHIVDKDEACSNNTRKSPGRKDSKNTRKINNVIKKIT